MGQLEHYFRENIRRCSLEQAGELLAETADAMGWHLAAFHADTAECRLPRDGGGEYIARRMGWPKPYLSEWSERRLGRDCPVAQRCERVAEPFWWECRPSSECWERALLPDQRNTLEYYGECADGAVTVPVHRPGAKTGYVSWFSRSPRGVRSLFAEHYASMYLVSHRFILHLDALEAGQPASERKPLTERELECLTWAARGKTEEEIGLIIGRSPATARFHLRNAVRKLDAGNRTHAVAKACSLGLVSPF